MCLEEISEWAEEKTSSSHLLLFSQTLDGIISSPKICWCSLSYTLVEVHEKTRNEYLQYVV